MLVFRAYTFGERPAHVPRGEKQSLRPGSDELQTAKETLSLQTPLLLVLCLAQEVG